MCIKERAETHRLRAGEAPTRDLAGSKAVLLSWGIEEAVSALQNALLAAANTDGHPRAGGEKPDPGSV